MWNEQFSLENTAVFHRSSSDFAQAFDILLPAIIAYEDEEDALKVSIWTPEKREETETHILSLMRQYSVTLQQFASYWWLRESIFSEIYLRLPLPVRGKALLCEGSQAYTTTMIAAAQSDRFTKWERIYIFRGLVEWLQRLENAKARKDEQKNLWIITHGVRSNLEDILKNTYMAPTIAHSPVCVPPTKEATTPPAETDTLESALMSDLATLPERLSTINTLFQSIISEKYTDFDARISHVKKKIHEAKSLLDEIGENMNTLVWDISWKTLAAFTETRQESLTTIAAIEHQCEVLTCVRRWHDIIHGASEKFEWYATWSVALDEPTFQTEVRFFTHACEEILSYIPLKTYLQGQDIDTRKRKRPYILIPDLLLPLFHDLWSLMRKSSYSLRTIVAQNENKKLGISPESISTILEDSPASTPKSEDIPTWETNQEAQASWKEVLKSAHDPVSEIRWSLWLRTKEDTSVRTPQWEDTSVWTIQPMWEIQDAPVAWHEDWLDTGENTALPSWWDSSLWTEKTSPTMAESLDIQTLVTVSRRSQRPQEKDPATVASRIQFYSQDLLRFLEDGNIHGVERMVDATLREWKGKLSISQDAITLLYYSKHPSIQAFLTYLFSDTKYTKPENGKHTRAWTRDEDNRYWSKDGKNPNITALYCIDSSFDTTEYKMRMRELSWKKVGAEWTAQNGKGIPVSELTGEIDPPNVANHSPNRNTVWSDTTKAWPWEESWAKKTHDERADATNTSHFSPWKSTSHELFFNRSTISDRCDYYTSHDKRRDILNRDTRRLEGYLQSTFESGRWRTTPTRDALTLIEWGKSDEALGTFLRAMARSPLYDRPVWEKEPWYKRLFGRSKVAKNNYWEKGKNANLELLFAHFGEANDAVTQESPNGHTPPKSTEKVSATDVHKSITPPQGWWERLRLFTFQDPTLPRESILTPHSTNHPHSRRDSDISDENVRIDLFMHCPREQTLIQFMMEAIDATILHGAWRSTLTPDMEALMNTENSIVKIARGKVKYSYTFSEDYRKDGQNANLDALFQEQWMKKSMSPSLFS